MSPQLLLIQTVPARVDCHSEQTLKATAIRKVMRPASHRRTGPIPILSA